MARNGSGTYSNPYPNFVAGTVISSDQVDANNSDIATALTQSIAVDGQAVVTADIPLATHKFTGMKVGTASTDSLSLGQAQAEAFVWCGTAGGGADAITLSPTPAITAYAAGQRFVWMASGSTNTTATTVAISGLTAIALQDNGAALTAGQHAAGKMFIGILNTTSTVQIMQVELAAGTDPLTVASLTVTGDATIGDDLTLLSDASVLGFGTNTDVTLTHNHDLGLSLSAGANATQLTITSTNDAAGVAPTIALVRDSASPAASDQLGYINFVGEDAGSNATSYAQVYANIVDPTGGSEDGSLKFYLITNGSAVAALELTGESAIFNGDATIGDDLSLDSDASVIKFGDNQDVLLTHVHDSGLTMSVTGNNLAQLGVAADNDTAAAGPYLNLTRTSASPADNDVGGIVQFVMENDNNQAFAAAQIQATAPDVSDGTEDGSLVINTMTNGSLAAALTLTSAGVNLADLDIDGGTDIGEAIVDADLLIIDNGAGGTNRKTAASRLKTYIGSGGKVLQVVQSPGAGLSSTSTSYVDVTNATIAITCASTDSKVFVTWTSWFNYGLVASANLSAGHKILRDSTILGTRDIAVGSGSGGLQITAPIAFSILDSPSSVSELTYKVQQIVTNASSTATSAMGYLTLMEIAG